MTNNKQSNRTSSLTSIVVAALGLPWIEIVTETWKLGRKILRGLTNEGMYEVLDYESTLELLNAKGTKAAFRKRMQVRYLQDEIIAFQDYAWGDGEVLLDYQTNLGRAVDRHRSGYKTYLLLSLREVKNRGDVDEFHIQWKIKNGFLNPDGYWSSSVSHRMKRIQVNIIFPKSRPPIRLYLEESNRKKTHVLGNGHCKQLADGRWRVTWKTEKPRLYELYVLRWDW